MPARTGCQFELALDIHPNERPDFELLARHGWRVQQLRFYARQPLTPQSGSSLRHRAKVTAYNAFRRVTRPIYAIWPSLADGMIIVATRTD